MMSVKSMTGFGRAILSTDEFDLTADIKSVNSKYLDCNFKIPRVLSAYELDYRKLLQEKIVRGKIELKIELQLKTTSKTPKINIELLSQYKMILETIKKTAELSEEISLAHYLRMPDLIEFIPDKELENSIENCAADVVREAAVNLNKMREKEGKELEKDILGRLSNLLVVIEDIESNKSDIFAHWLDKFKTRLTQFNITEANNERIVQEAIIFSEKADITEELTRAKSHIDQCLSMIRNEREVGKKLDFLSIELTREFNTIASKSSNCGIINSVVAAKAEVDRIREQVQNLL